MNVNAIFDAVAKATNYVHLQDEIYKKQAQVRNVLSKRCGNCWHWMKSSCVPEKEHNQFKSCDSFGCKDFSLCPFSKELAKKFENELECLKKKIESRFNR